MRSFIEVTKIDNGYLLETNLFEDGQYKHFDSLEELKKEAIEEVSKDINNLVDKDFED